MNQIQIEYKLNKVWRYMILLFAFICCGFVFNSSKVEAKPEVSLPDGKIERDSTGKVSSFTFYIGWDTWEIVDSNVTIYSSTSSWVATLEKEGSDKPENVSAKYLSGKDATAVCTDVGFNCTKSFFAYTVSNIENLGLVFESNVIKIVVFADNYKLLLFGSGETTLTKEYVYDNKSPDIVSANVSVDGDTNTNVGIGKKIKFSFALNEPANVNYAANGETKVVFKIGTREKNAACSSDDEYTFSCVYTVKSGDKGSVSSPVKIINGTNIVDSRGNAMIGTVEGLVLTGIDGFEIDGIVASVKNVYVENTNKIYTYVAGENNSFKVKVDFNDNLKVVSGFTAPTLKIKIGNVERSCKFEGAELIMLSYSCSYTETDQGVVTFVSLSGGNKITDKSGNALSLPYSVKKEFSGVIVDNRIPSLKDSNGISLSVEDCAVNENSYYCKGEGKFTVTFEFNMDVSLLGSKVQVRFGDNLGRGVIQNIDTTSTNNRFEVNYVIDSRDVGQMTINYEFDLKAKSNNKVNKVEGDYQSSIYVDNKAPSIGEIDVLVDEEKIEGKVIYGSSKETIVKFVINVEEDSSLTLVDPSKVVIIDETNNVLEVNSEGTLGVVGVDVSLVENSIVVLVAFKGESDLNFRIRIEKGAIRDFFGWELENEYFYSEIYTINTKLPSFKVNVNPPIYNGYRSDESWILISGDSIEYTIDSEDKDLKDFCVVVNREDECKEYKTLIKDDVNVYEFNKNGNGEYSFYVRVRDNSLNVKEELVKFKVNDMFNYSNGEKSVAKMHSITVNLSSFENNTMLKYDWFKRGKNVDFNNANTTVKQDDNIVIDGVETFNGDYRVCILDVEDNGVLCSEYVIFDTVVEFKVSVEGSAWSNGDLPVTIEFKDSSAIKCIVVGKNVSDLGCDKTGNENVTIYRTSQAINPLKKYKISENGVYHFYIEDMVGNVARDTKTITNIDKDSIEIDVYNGLVGDYNTNLELDQYKKSHSFLVTFDKDVTTGSKHSLYRYFYSFTKYNNITTKDIFNAYYSNSLYKQEFTNGAKSININTPSVDGVYCLYIMAVDGASNVSFEVVENIKVDVSGPLVKMYDSNNKQVNGGSTSYIAVFNYSVVLEDKDSKLNLNTISYKWVNDSNNTVLEKKYDGCGFNYDTCIISGSEIEFESGVFKPTEKYRFILTAFDMAGNETKFISNEFLIDTTPPIVEFEIDENAWYESGNVTFTVSKENNGTLNSISYCLNDCLNSDETYKISSFKEIKVTNNKSVTKTLNLTLKDGVNILYVYASDVFGNSVYEHAKINFDSEDVEIKVTNLNEDKVVDLTDSDNLSFEFIVKDGVSGVSEYCVYYNNDSSNKTCYDGNGEKEVSKTYSVTKNGVYSIEAIDMVGNKTIYNVSVIGIDTEPIEFDLISNVKNNEFVSSNLVVSIVNMRKFMVDDVNDRVKTIDYVKLAYSASVEGNEETLFTSNDNVSIYKKGISESLVTSFSVSENGTYVVRVVDTGGNVSYKFIRINNIDSVAPFVNTNKYPDLSDRIYVKTSSGKHMRVFIKDDGVSKVYKYANDVIKVHFGSDSLKDLSTGYNNYLALKVCFNADSCVYNTYNVSTSLSEGYLTNSMLSITAPYNFSGVIQYYLVDGALNSSDVYSFEVEYQNEVEEIDIVLKDLSGVVLNENKKYSSVNVSLVGDEVEEIITNNGMKYALVKSNINMYNQLANNTGSINNFLSNYGFSGISSNNFEVSRVNVSEEYYLWIYVTDLLGNVKLLKSSDIINLDSVAPSFDEIGLVINKLNSTEYDLDVSNVISEYSLYIDSNNDGSYEEITLVNKKASFTVSGLDSVNFKLVDGAGNYVVELFNLNVSSKVYAKVYQINNSRQADIVVYNLGSKNVTSFRYIITDINSSFNYDENTINDDNIVVCNGYEDICKGSINNYKQKGVYNIDISNFNKDKKVIFYIYVDGELIDLVEKDIIVDIVAPQVSFTQGNPVIISTVNGMNHNFMLSVSEINLSDLTDKKFVITTKSSISSFVSTYDSCVNSSSCARGVYDLNDDLIGNIEINGNSSKFNSLSTGTYYLYVNISDDYGNETLLKSSAIYVDNESPNVQYSISNNPNSYTNINEVVYVGEAVKLKLSDNYKVKYLEIYENDVLSTVCYINNSSLDNNCVRNSSGEIGLVVVSDVAYYYLDNGYYKVKVYDEANNVKEIEVNVDGRAPRITLYKKVGGVYEEQISGKKMYNDLSSLYVSVDDDNFSYLTIDLENTNNGQVITNASRYSYNSDIGVCLVDRNECEYGVSLTNLLLGNTIQYNKIVVKVYDKALKYTSIEINYDDVLPEIWTLDVGESIYLGGLLYTLGEGKTINVEIGVNPQLTLSSLLSKVVLDVDGRSYDDIKNSEMFKVTVYKDSDIFDKEVSEYIGNYIVKLNYVDGAGNEAEEKEIKVNVLDNTLPEFELENNVMNAEIKEQTIIEGILARDNYGLEINGTVISKEKMLYLSDAVCKYIVDEVVGDCDKHFVKDSDDVYRFISSGKYEFVYTITDLAGNEISVTQVINASDSLGPVMSSSTNNQTTFELSFNERVYGQVSIDQITLSYPNSVDVGDNANKTVEYVGLFGLNNMGEKYKVEDIHKVSDSDNKVTYLFKSVGTYYLRFSSSDSNDNISIFEYEVKVRDNMAPKFKGVSDKEVIKLDLDEVFSVEYLISKCNITVSDNYDSNVNIFYELRSSSEHSHEIVLKSSDTSNNLAEIVIYVDIEDYEAPVVGEIVLEESTNKTINDIIVIGGSDNSSNWWHEYSIQGGKWVRVEQDSKLEFGLGLSQEIQVCVRAVDAGNENGNNYSENTSCKIILVDTKAPVIEGVKDGEILSNLVKVSVSDERLDKVEVWKDNVLLELTVDSLPFEFSEVGKYQVIASDALENETVVNFMIDTNVSVNIINDIHSQEYAVSSVEFDKRMLVKVDISYDENGYSNIYAKLDNISINTTDMLYILGILPDSQNSFVIFSVNGVNIGNYKNGINLIGNGSNFREDLNNEDCFIKFNDEYYAYVIVKENVYNDPVAVVDDNAKNSGDNKLLGGLFIGLGVVIVLIVGYQIVKFRKRVRAA